MTKRDRTGRRAPGRDRDDDRSFALGHVPVPRGELQCSHVVSDPADPLETALSTRLTGYLVLVPQETLLLDGDTHGVVTFEDGVPVLAYNPASDRGGSAALADVAVAGPYRIELHELAANALDRLHENEAFRVPPGMPAEELADAPALADRTRDRAPSERLVESDPSSSHSAVESFLADDDRIDTLREQAREEAAERAAEWGLDMES
ncbi:hypothetical protein ACERIT_00475 [Halopenitus sp. H-Gu1]|uniref:hypothetical protein n=1 Tax=Halopenitus sp. H-Gu1 TaxID=3242697 RepID=UPI00359E9FCD